MSLYAANGDGLAVGQRVELSPATDAWMSGARFGTITRLQGGQHPRVSVRLDRVRRTIVRFSPDLIGSVLA